MDHHTPSTNPTLSQFSSSKSNKSLNKEKKGGARKCKGVRLSTDQQSVAARERRHRISDRFKILQSMVPGGSKMDTVSMLEEAIQYVKFLKTQIWLHQTMINFMDNDNNNNNNYESSSSLPSPLLHPNRDNCYYFPSEQFFSPQPNAVFDYDNMQDLAQCSFQGEDTTYIDASLKYWPAWLINIVDNVIVSVFFVICQMFMTIPMSVIYIINEVKA